MKIPSEVAIIKIKIPSKLENNKLTRIIIAIVMLVSNA